MATEGGEFNPPTDDAEETLTADPTEQTPAKSAAGSKACSTPTSEDKTLPDLTLDASRISVLNSTVQNATVTASGAQVPRTKPRSGTTQKKLPLKTNSSNRSVAAANSSRVGRSTGPGRQNKTGSHSISQESKKDLTCVAEVSGDVTQEMLELAYTRYLQAKFIEMKSREAREQVEREAREQIFRAQLATQQLQQRILEEKEKVQVNQALEVIKKSLEIVEDKMEPMLQAVREVNEKLGLVVGELDHAQHHLPVQGIDLKDQETAKKELDKISDVLIKFNDNFSAYKEQVREQEDVGKMAVDYKIAAEKYVEVLSLVAKCRKMIEEENSLAVQEASLAVSMEQLKSVTI